VCLTAARAKKTKESAPGARQDSAFQAQSKKDNDMKTGGRKKKETTGG